MKKKKLIKRLKIKKGIIKSLQSELANLHEDYEVILNAEDELSHRYDELQNTFAELKTENSNLYKKVTEAKKAEDEARNEANQVGYKVKSLIDEISSREFAIRNLEKAKGMSIADQEHYKKLQEDFGKAVKNTTNAQALMIIDLEAQVTNLRHELALSKKISEDLKFLDSQPNILHHTLSVAQGNEEN